MKLKVYHVLFFVSVLGSCQKNDSTKSTPPTPKDTTKVDTTDTLTAPIDSFITYRILKGKNYCENNSYPLWKQSSLRFVVIFDSSCIYTNVDPVNQADINKLYGFSDCTTLHHANSARFGWNWINGAIHIHAYCYVDSVRQYKELGAVSLNKEVNCSIETLPGKYVFTLNGKRDTMLRHCTDSIANGIKLFPYFGGDEPAPHDIQIKIKELK